LGVGRAIGVNSGTSALQLGWTRPALRPGDKVLVPTSTFIATVWAVICSAVPVLCDVAAASGTIDSEDAERRSDRSVKAIISVHLYGQPASLEAVMAVADRYGCSYQG
jgi:dTDP-4-amino-4,6-dideoxygalactose transaminase